MHAKRIVGRVLIVLCGAGAVALVIVGLCLLSI